MAIIFIEGYDYYHNTNAGVVTTIIGTYLDNVANRNCYNMTSTRFGVGNAIACDDGGTYATTARIPFAANAIATYGGALQKNAAAGNYGIIAFGESSGADFQVGLQIDTTNKLVVRRGNPTSGTILATGTRTIVNTEWNYLEMKVGIHSSTGFVEVRVNNISDISITGVNTRNTANSFVNKVCLLGGSSFNIVHDDSYVTDENLPNSGFLGDCRVQTIVPTGTGVNNGWTASGATSGWQCLDDTAAQIAGTYSDTDFVYGSSTGIKFECAMSDLSGTSPTVFGIAVSNVSKKGDAGARTCQNLIYTNSTEASGAAYNLSTSYINYTDLFNTNPVTASSWTPTEVNNLQVGQLIAT